MMASYCTAIGAGMMTSYCTAIGAGMMTSYGTAIGAGMMTSYGTAIGAGMMTSYGTAIGAGMMTSYGTAIGAGMMAMIVGGVGECCNDIMETLSISLLALLWFCNQTSHANSMFLLKQRLDKIISYHINTYTHFLVCGPIPDP